MRLVQAAAKLASGLVSTVWHVVDDMVVTPALQVREGIEVDLIPS